MRLLGALVLAGIGAALAAAPAQGRGVAQSAEAEGVAVERGVLRLAGVRWTPGAGDEAVAEPPAASEADGEGAPETPAPFVPNEEVGVASPAALEPDRGVFAEPAAAPPADDEAAAEPVIAPEGNEDVAVAPPAAPSRNGGSAAEAPAASEADERAAVAPATRAPQDREAALPFEGAIPAADPAAAVATYYADIKTLPYRQSWERLSDKMQQVGYGSYLRWWDGAVRSVHLEHAELQEQAAQTATVRARIYYEKSDGKRYCSDDVFGLVLADDGERWLIDEQTYKTCRTR